MDRQTARKLATELVNQMTLEEKASQLRYDSPAVERLGIPAYNWWNEALHGVARAGTATVFPQAIGLASIFDPAFHERIANAVSTEARAKYNMQSQNGDRDIYKGLSMWSPNINIFRDPRWGRGHETCGEDPYLTARLGCAYVRGLQGKGAYLKTAACAKHFAVHSGPESLRHAFDAEVSPKDLRETYLPAFEALVRESKVESVMGAYNCVNGEPACGSKTLLRDILREEWGFEGHVVSDCWAIADFHTHHHVTDTAPQSAALALQNGCDLNCGNTYLQLLAAYQEGLVTEEQITAAAVHVYTSRFLLGVFAKDCEYDAITIDQNDSDEHASLALCAAEKCMVLLKNDGVLPLDLHRLSSVAVIGPNADSVPCLEGNYSGTSSRYTTFLRGIREACEGKARVYYAQGCHLFKDRVSNLAQPDDRLAEAVAIAKRADVSILCLGLDATLEGEEGDAGNEYSSGDKNTLELPQSQRKLLAAICQLGKPVIVLNATGSAVRVEDGNAILQVWYPGQAGGTAAANLLFGKTNPCGKLPVTFYRSVEDLPAFVDYSMANRTYRYFAGTPLYPFGYGLSYTRFAYRDAVYANGAVAVNVANVGGIDGEESVEVYVKACDSPAAVPNHSLCAMLHVALKAGEERRVTLPIDPSSFETVQEDGSRRLTGHRFVIFVGGSQPDARSVALVGAEPMRVEVLL
ncbi:MAG: glycoside hydrolase family 3 C-terminal domain-containing protein [Clostridia bacterium]